MEKFDIYPALDLKDGNCVRLVYGDITKETIYQQDPLKQVSYFIENGCKWLHVVDLNAALNTYDNKQIILDILKTFKKDIKVQLGGGIRSTDQIKFWIDKGITRVIVGTLAYENPSMINSLGIYFKKKIALGVDVRDNYLAVNGWKKQLKIRPIELIKKIDHSLIDAVIYTDISRDGTLRGVNISETLELSKEVCLPVIASGGISGIEEIKRLKKLKDKGIVGVIIGKALYENKISFNEINKIII